MDKAQELMDVAQTAVHVVVKSTGSGLRLPGYGPHTTLARWENLKCFP